mmetsp:Transcript_12031/g.28529  ORF Transcript_12031/g.28529 Transcript_12031/m.28529 type:complete len:526 (+) Transcript_12031:55-1632(+)
MKHKGQIGNRDDGQDNDSPYASHIETSFQPMDISFHPQRDNLVAAALVDGSLEVHDFRRDRYTNSEDSEDEFESLLSSLSLHSSSNYKEKLSSKKYLTTSCKCVAFSPDGTKIYTGGSYGDLCAVDAERACTFSTTDKNKPLWRINSAAASIDRRNKNSGYDTLTSKNNPLVVLYPFRKDGEAGTPLLATGDDYGGLRIWDERICGVDNNSDSSGKRPTGCVLEWNQQQDYISGIEYSPHGNGKDVDGNNILLATCADGTLGVYDLRMNKGTLSDKSRKSDHLDDELLSLCVLKSGKKVVCGTQTGALSIFSWGTWGDISDRFPGHPSSVETLLKIDENTLLTGSSDGLIRVVQIHPDKLLGLLNDGDKRGNGSGDHEFHIHERYPVEKLAYNSNKDIVGSLSHDNFIQLWDARILRDEGGGDGADDDDDEEEESDNGEKCTQKLASIPRPIKVDGVTTKKIDSNVKYNSDDDWEDMDNETDVANHACDIDSDSDSDESVPEPETANDRRKKRLKTENEIFFDDL